MNILIISPDYPDQKRTGGVFVKKLVDEFAKLGNHCTVISPYSITNNKAFYTRGVEQQSIGKGTVTVYRPNFISISKLRVGKFTSGAFRIKAIYRALKRINTKFDFCYCHFWYCGFAVYKYAQSHGLPLFVATGESVIPTLFKNDRYKPIYDYIRGVICVSTKNRDESVGLGMTTEDKCIVVPNAIDNTMFKLLDKIKCRDELNLPQDAFITATVGWFTERKGQERVAQAITELGDEKIKSVFLGDGDAQPKGSHIVFCGHVKHDLIPKYLNAADVYVLPTRKEGCCNSIIEAMACGLPIISSDRSFNYDVLDQDNSIMIEPDDIGQIKTAIERVKSDKTLRDKMRSNSLERAKQLTIDQRAKTILGFISSRIQK